MQIYGSSASATYYIPSSLRSVTVTGGWLTRGAFYGCSMLTSVTIGNGVVDIYKSAFEGCSGLVEMTIPFVGKNATATTASESTLFGYIFGFSTSSQTGTIRQYYSSSGIIYAYIPSSLRSVTVTGGNLLYGAFMNCSMLTSVTIGNGVTCIGDKAFANCSGLPSVSIGNGVSSIGTDAFKDCDGLTAVYYMGTIAEWCGITFGNVFSNPLYYAHNLYIDNTLVSDLVIPNTVTEIKNYAFDKASCFTSVTIPDSVTSIGVAAFQYCRGLTSVTIPNSVTSIDDRAFSYCSGLTSVNFNATNCTSMPHSSQCVFTGCTSLSTLNIGENVTNIPNYAFLGCGLTDIYVNRMTPPTTGTSAFNQYTATLWVPCGSAAAYSAADGWSNFSDIRETGASLLSVSSANPQMGTASITLQPSCSNGNATIVATPNEGYRFVQWNDGNTDNPRSLYVSSPVEYVASFEAIPTYTITAVSADEATGTVTGGGIFYEGETATLTATPAEGYRFATWNDGNTDNPRTVTVTEDATYTASFAVFHTITVTTADETQGTASGSGDYAEGSQVEISATPAEHHHFTQWNDGNTDNPRTITVASDSTFTASFAIDQHTVTVVSADTEMGTVSEGGTYDYGTEIQISATPAEGYGFVAWNDGNTDNPRTVTVTEDITYTATFGAWRTITVLSADETMGTVSEGGVYVEGSQVEISANAAEHYHFVQWNDENTDNPRTITVTSDSTFTATFAIDQHTITVESADASMGTVSESNTYDYGTEIQISATASEHYHFVQWNDGNTDNPRTITVTGDATYIATFAPNNYTIVVRSLNEDWGTVSEGGTFPYGTEIQISATPRENYAFVAWTDGNTDNPRTITVTGDAEYVAAFTWSVSIEQSTSTEITLFPNPATDILNITSSENISEIEIVNALGQVVYRTEVNGDNAVCDVNGLTSGVYIVRITAASASPSTTLREQLSQRVIQQKFIKE